MGSQSHPTTINEFINSIEPEVHAEFQSDSRYQFPSQSPIRIDTQSSFNIPPLHQDCHQWTVNAGSQDSSITQTPYVAFGDPDQSLDVSSGQSHVKWVQVVNYDALLLEYAQEFDKIKAQLSAHQQKYNHVYNFSFASY